MFQGLFFALKFVLITAVRQSLPGGPAFHANKDRNRAKEKGPDVAIRAFFVNRIWYRLQRNDILCLGAFLTLSYSELYALTFGQGFEAFTFDCLEMGKYIGTGFAGNKTKTFSFIKPFNGASNCRHLCILFAC
jgi:hypothetical protein